MNYTPSQNLELFVWDVGHGLSITAVTPNFQVPSEMINRRKVVQIDTGDNGDLEFSPIRHLVENRGLSIIDYLILTHADQDHISDLPVVYDLVRNGKLMIKTLLRNRTIPHFEISEDPQNESMAKTVYKSLDLTYVYPVPQNEDLGSPQNFGGVFFQTAYIPHRQGMSLNDSSVVTVITYGSTQVIIPGDIEASGAEELINSGAMPLPDSAKFRILIAPHHGRESAEPAKLLEHFKPHIVLASAMSGDEYTDSIYTSSAHVTGLPIIESDGRTVNRHKFRATKGEAFHITIDASSPLIRRIAYQPAVAVR